MPLDWSGEGSRLQCSDFAWGRGLRSDGTDATTSDVKFVKLVVLINVERATVR